MRNNLLIASLLLATTALCSNAVLAAGNTPATDTGDKPKIEINRDVSLPGPKADKPAGKPQVETGRGSGDNDDANPGPDLGPKSDDKPEHGKPANGKSGPARPDLYNIACDFIETDEGLFIEYTNKSAKPIVGPAMLWAHKKGTVADVGYFVSYGDAIDPGESVKLGPLDPRDFKTFVGQACEGRFEDKSPPKEEDDEDDVPK